MNTATIIYSARTRKISYRFFDENDRIALLRVARARIFGRRSVTTIALLLVVFYCAVGIVPALLGTGPFSKDGASVYRSKPFEVHKTAQGTAEGEAADSFCSEMKFDMKVHVCVWFASPVDLYLRYFPCVT